MNYRILLLQGPVGGFFRFLHRELQQDGFSVRRLVFNGGDILFALGSDYEVVKSVPNGFGVFFRDMLRDWAPHAVVLFGDERPIHHAAVEEARKAGIPVWCFEEGYIRPDHVTFEEGGNNANSRLIDGFDPHIAPRRITPAPKLRGQTSAMARAAIFYFIAHRTTRTLFSDYTHHRERRLRDELRFWIRSLYRRAVSSRHDARLVKSIVSGLHPPFFLVALQVHDDLQLRRHGRGWKNMTFAEMVLESFKRASPAGSRLVIKAHPLDVGHGHHKKNIQLLIETHGLQDRVVYLQSGPLVPIVRHARGLITINSTAGIAALRNDVPVLAFGNALYHVAGLSHQPQRPEELDRFWVSQPPVDKELAWKFGEYVMSEVLLPGSFYLSSTWRDLASEVASRLRTVLGPVDETTTRLGDDVAPQAGTGTHAPPAEHGLSATAAVTSMAQPLRVGILSPGIWAQRTAVRTLLGAEPVRLRWPRTADCDVIVGWGHKPTSMAARALARRRNAPYVALEDGFLRSVRPGAGEKAIGWIVDRSGIYYDSTGPSDLEAAITGRIGQSSEAEDRGATVMRALRDLRLSKYNHAPMASTAALGLPSGENVVLVIDQTFGDASISGAGADSATFALMLNAAVTENPGRTIAVKVHPEAISKAKRGYLLEIARRHPVVVVAADVNPWALIEIAHRVYVVSSQFGLEALLAGVPVTCFGRAFYAGWGLTDDRFVPIDRRAGGVTAQGLAGAVYLDYCRWIDPYHGTEIDFDSAIDRLAFLRDRFQENTGSVCVGFSRWKRKAASRFLSGIGGKPSFARSAASAVVEADRSGARIVVWGSRLFADGTTDASGGRRTVVRAEDGFLRSVGLGAAFVAPASLVFDAEGVYYDPSRPSGFETIAASAEFDDALLARAAKLRMTIVARGLSKYNDSGERRLAFPDRKVRILVPGQVEDDASMRYGSTEVPTNLELLRRVRARWPDGHVIYKPHPDVHAGFRVGRIPAEVARGLADQVVTDISMPSLLSQVDRVETMTSLTGFEALLRGLPVTTHGVPFYAGWGLTEALMPCDRRTRRLTLDQLVAAALILYPRYVDPDTGLPCPVETIVERLTQGRIAAGSRKGRMKQALRWVYAWSAHNIWGPIFVGITRLAARK